MSTTRDSRATSHLSEARCADLALGLRDDGERDAAFVHAAGCAPCEERLRLTFASHERARAVADELVGARSPAVVRLPARPRAAWRTPAWTLAAAAALVALVFVPRLMRAPRLERERFHWLTTSEGGLVSRDADQAGDADIRAGIEAYQHRDLARARRLLERARATGVLEDARRVFLGNTWLALGEPARALDALRAVEWHNVPPPWREEAQWTLQLALRRAGRTIQADSVAHALERTAAETPSSP